MTERRKIQIKLKCVVKTDKSTSTLTVPTEHSEIESKMCNVCQQIKPLTDYYARYARCKECIKANQRDRNKQSKEKRELIKHDVVARSKPKQCNTCGQIKTILDFRENRGACIECERSYGRDYNKSHQDIRRAWVESHPDRMRELHANWYQENKTHVLVKYYERYHNDEAFRTGVLMKKKLQNAINCTNPMRLYCGVTTGLIKKWLEYNFDDKMTWENYGKVWHVDHVIPITWFDLSQQSEVDFCFGWKNISPLNGLDNIVKGNSVMDEQLDTHFKRLTHFVEEENLDDNVSAYIEQCRQKLNSIGETP